MAADGLTDYFDDHEHFPKTRLLSESSWGRLYCHRIDAQRMRRVCKEEERVSRLAAARQLKLIHVIHIQRAL